MLDDLLEGLLEGLGHHAIPTSRRAQSCFRIAFGLLLVGLSGAGVWKTWTYPAGLPFRLAGMALFAALALFGLLNMVLLRPVRWPGCLVLLAFVGLFAVRLLFGA